MVLCYIPRLAATDRAKTPYLPTYLPFEDLRVTQLSKAFADWLLRLGNGTEPHDEPGRITLPTDRWPEICEPDGADIGKLSEWVYPGLLNVDQNDQELVEQQMRLATDGEWLSKRAILTPLNKTVD